MLALSTSAFAGHMPCGGFTEDPLPPTAEEQVDVAPSDEGEMSAGIAEVIATAMQGVLSVF